MSCFPAWARAVLFCFVLDFSLTKDAQHPQAGFNIPVFLLDYSLVLDTEVF